MPATLFSVRGEGSLLDLSDLAVLSMNSHYFDSPKIVEALDAGRLDFSGLTTVTGARSDSHRLQFRVANGGQMELPQLRSVDGTMWFRMEVPEYAFPSLQTAQDSLFDLGSNRTVRLPALSSISGSSAGLIVGEGSLFEATNLLSFSDATLDLGIGGTIDVPRLATFQNARLDLAPGKNFFAPPLRNIDNARFSATRGATLAVAATAYDWTYHYGDGALLTADGTSSLLDLRTVERLRMNQHYFDRPKEVTARNGGRIDLSGLLQVV